MTKQNLVLAAALAVAIGSYSAAADWLAAPSRYTHSPDQAHRVLVYAPIPPVYHTPTHVRSVYRHSRSSLQIGDSIDQYHTVDEFGRPVRPYGEWRFPFRPFSVPYPLWGPRSGGGYGYGYPGYGRQFGAFGPFGAVNGAGFPPPWNDGSFPDVRRNQNPPRDFNGPNFDIDNNVQGSDNNINNNLQ